MIKKEAVQKRKTVGISNVDKNCDMHGKGERKIKSGYAGVTAV